mmetsp:Transcript_10351/g.36356  ORF Transcript_10351/g.36356 Transcript_10351/m.36356 type:complete len:308 (-) Transcript_10351:1769-2692(-)
MLALMRLDSLPQLENAIFPVDGDAGKTLTQLWHLVQGRLPPDLRGQPVGPRGLRGGAAGRQLNDLAVESLTVHTPIHLAAQGLRVPAECIALHGRKELIGICLVQISAQVGDEPLARCRVQAQALRGFDLVPAVPLGEASGEERGVRDSLAREEPKCCTVCVLRSPHRRHRQAKPLARNSCAMIPSSRQDDSKAPGSCVILDFGSACLAEHSLRRGCLRIVARGDFLGSDARRPVLPHQGSAFIEPDALCDDVASPLARICIHGPSALVNGHAVVPIPDLKARTATSLRVHVGTVKLLKLRSCTAWR